MKKEPKVSVFPNRRGTHHARLLMSMISLAPVHTTIPPRVHDTINAVLGPDGISVKKNEHVQRAEILGILI